jgi:hypothetical protein
VVGDNGTILKTTNGGTNWTLQPSWATDGLYSVHFPDSSTGWAVGDNGTILKTTNGGSFWATQQSGTVSSLYSVYFTNNSTGWAVGGNGTILKTTNDGTNWTTQTSGTNNNLFSVHFPDNVTGWIVGGGGTIFKTTNGGTNWTTQTSGTQNELESVYFLNSGIGWAVGGLSTILKTTDGGLVGINIILPEVPKGFNLDQNYPNPFNPVTTISYGIPEAGNVKLKVYDLSGREVKALINEHKDAGYYTVSFDASGLASGAYFYRVESGSYVSVKKMVLLK